MEKLRALIADAQAGFARLTERERRLVTLAGLAVAGLVVFLVIWSFSSAADRYRKNTQTKLGRLAEVQSLAASFREAERERQAAEQQLSSSNVSLMSYLGDKVTAAGLEIPPMNPKAEVTHAEGKIVESAVELNLSEVKLGKLVDFLSAVESGPGVVKVKYLRVEPKPSSESLTAWVTVATYKLKP